MTTTDDWLGFSTHVTYESDNGLAVASMHEWRGIGVSFNNSGTAVEFCFPPKGIDDDSGSIGSFDCILAPPYNPPVVPAGTYKLGTIIWDTSATTPGRETIAAYIDDRVDGFVAVINGNIAIFYSAQITQNSAVLNIIPEPGTATLLGLGLVGLVFTARRRRG